MSTHDRLPPVCPAPACLIQRNTLRRYFRDLSASSRSVGMLFLRSFVVINFPSQIAAKGLRQHASGMRSVHHNVVLEALVADVAQEFLQLRHTGHCPVAECFQLVVGQFTLPDISPNYSAGIVGRQSAEG